MKKRLSIMGFAIIVGIWGIAYAHHHSGSEMHSHVIFKPISYDLLERYHGHVGPYVVIGAKMGEDAVVEHSMPRYFGVEVVAECPDGPPHSCLIDGLQATTGATMGKRNIRIEPSDTMRVTIENTETGLTCVYELTPAIEKQLQEWIKKDVPVEERGEITFNMKPEELFTVLVKQP